MTPETTQSIALPVPYIPRGRAIVRQVLVDHAIASEDFFGLGRWGHLVAARRDAATRLRQAGFSWRRCGIILKRNQDTVRSYLTPAMQTRRRDRMRDRRAFAFMASDVVEIIIAYAKAENVKPEVLISQWATERATYEFQAKARAA